MAVVKTAILKTIIIPRGDNGFKDSILGHFWALLKRWRVWKTWRIIIDQNHPSLWKFPNPLSKGKSALLWKNTFNCAYALAPSFLPYLPQLPFAALPGSSDCIERSAAFVLAIATAADGVIITATLWAGPLLPGHELVVNICLAPIRPWGSGGVWALGNFSGSGRVCRFLSLLPPLLPRPPLSSSSKCFPPPSIKVTES